MRAPARDQLGGVNRETAGIQPDDIGGLAHLQVDFDFAGKRVLLRNYGEIQAVAHRPDVVAEAELGRLGEGAGGEQDEGDRRLWQ